MEDVLKYVVTFVSGGLAGNFFNHFMTNKKNSIQELQCHYIEDETISQLPISYENQNHENLYSKKFKIINTTNRDIDSIKIIFTFEPRACIAKWKSYSKVGANIPKGKIYQLKNECQFVIKHFNRNEEIEILLEIGNITEHTINITEQNITGVKIKFLDKRKSKQVSPITVVQRKELSTSS